MKPELRTQNTPRNFLRCEAFGSHRALVFDFGGWTGGPEAQTPGSRKGGSVSRVRV